MVRVEQMLLNPQQYPLRSARTLSTAKFESHFKPHLTLLCNDAVSVFDHERPCLCNHLNQHRSSHAESSLVHFSSTKPPRAIEFHNQNTRARALSPEDSKSQPILAQHHAQVLTSSSGKQSPIGLVPRIPGNRERASAKHVLRPRVQK